MAGAAAVGGLSLSGCLSGGGGGGGGGGGYQITIISSPAGFDDQAFNDNALSGLEDAAEEWDIDINQVEETNQGAYAERQADAAEAGPDLIVLVADQHTDPLRENAPEYPDVNWMLINNVVEEPNVSGWIEMNHEMSFLAGVGAGTLTHEEIEHEGSSTNPDESTVGFVGGEEIPLIKAFEASYIQGVEWVDDSIEVLTGYGGSFSDPSGVNDQAVSQFDSGADIVWHAASAAGEGAFQAADDSNRFAIGVDSDQSVAFDSYQDVILGSAIKALNEATYEVAKAVVNDEWDSVQGEQNLSTEGGQIDWVTGQAFDGDMPDSLDQNIQDAKDAIINGEIDFECGPTGC
ncbi:BMP family lipoprotein [Haloprofundus halobius]|uniref:BMP family lipoprotein n=1 Tax=Haloprofundus halobius TaxID=2876194 RepID=UPI001CCF68EF|nr:BMP family ABC transporter substrate-binding protein [Haloprofundus halobius]